MILIRNVTAVMFIL